MTCSGGVREKVGLMEVMAAEIKMVVAKRVAQIGRGRVLLPVAQLPPPPRRTAVER